MENTSPVSIPLVDILSELLGKRVVMSGEKYVEFETLKEIPSADIRTAETLKVEKQIVQDKLNECIAFLNKTEFKFNGDYDLKDTPKWLELKAKRQEYREFIRANNG